MDIGEGFGPGPSAAWEHDHVRKKTSVNRNVATINYGSNKIAEMTKK